MNFYNLLDVLISAADPKPAVTGSGELADYREVEEFLLVNTRSSAVGVALNLLQEDTKLGFEVDVECRYDSSQDTFWTELSITVLGSAHASEGLFLLTYGFTYYANLNAFNIVISHSSKDLLKLL